MGLYSVCPLAPLLQAYVKYHAQMLYSRHVQNMAFKGSIVGIYIFRHCYRYRF
jgi:hypothetical protein